MGIHDRDYYKEGSRAGPHLLGWTESAVGVLIAANIICFIAQLAGGEPVTEFLSARPRDVFGAGFWKVLTANFAHSTEGRNAMYHILGNMLFLGFLGREVEQIYGRRNFYTLYLAAGVLAIFAEAALRRATGEVNVPILGASGAVQAVVVVAALFYPTKTIYFLFFLPAPLWLLCGFFLAQDVFGLLSSSRGVANLAHLTGAAVGLVYKMLDLRWELIGSRMMRGRVRVVRQREVHRELVLEPSERSRRDVAGAGGAPDAVSRRIDDLLAKISSSGKESLTAEEWDFLKENSGRYRSE